jgi:hypothetical protein
MSRIVAVVGYPGYFVSDRGEVFSSKRQGSTSTHWPMFKKKLASNKSGYLIVKMMDLQHKKHVRFVHVVVAESFLGLRPSPKHQCDHIDGNRSNNVVANLRWVTPLENTRSAIARNGGTARQKISLANAIMIRCKRRSGMKIRELAEWLGVSDSCISAALYCRTSELRKLGLQKCIINEKISLRAQTRGSRRLSRLLPSPAL